MPKSGKRAGTRGEQVGPRGGTDDAVARSQAVLKLLKQVRDETDLDVVLARICQFARTTLGWSRAEIVPNEAGTPVADGTAFVLPIATATERFGALVVESCEAQRDADAATEELEALADLAATAIANARLQERLRATAREAEALFRASTLLVDTTDVDRLLDKIMDAVDEHFGHPICTIHLRHADTNVLALRAFRGHAPGDDQRIDVVDGPSIVARVARTGEACNVPDVAADPDYVVAIRDTASELAVPLVIDGAVIGVINVESPTPNSFSDSDVRVLTSFAEQAAVAVHTAQLHETMRKRVRREALVNSIISAVHATTDLNEILKIPCTGLSEALDVQRAYVAILDWAEGVARFVQSFASNESPRFTGSFPLSALPELAERLWRNEVVAVADVFAEPMLDAARWSYEKFNTRSLVYMPVVRLGDWHAVLLVCCETVRHWTDDEVAFIKTVAEQVGTAFVQAELFDKVLQSKREWERTFDTMSDGVLLVDAEREIYGANAAAAAMMRVSREKLIGLRCCQALASAVDGTCPAHGPLAGGSRIRVQTVPRRIGRQTEVTVDPVAGERGAVVVLRDVSELRRVEADARRQSVVLSQIVSSSSDPIAMLDTDGTIVWHNDALGRATGLGANGGRALRVNDVVTPDARSTMELELGRAAAGEPRFFETALGGRDTPETWIFATLTPVFDDTVLAGVLLVGRDITGHRRAAERAAEADKLRALGQLSSGVAHNFNNALSVILGRTQLLLRRAADERMQRDLSIIEQVAHEATNTVRRIQNFARRRIQESFASVDVRALIAETVEMTSTRWRGDANARGIRYTVDVTTADGDVTVLGNDSELREVFVNILFNALDAMPHGGRVSISVAREGGFVAVHVADEGYGMDVETQRHVFEPFFTTKGAKGTGLGLAVSYGIVSRHDGHIAFRTSVGQGTTFTVTLPARATRAAASEIERRLPQLGGRRIAAEVIVVDDDATVCEIVAEALRDRGHVVRCAASAAEALRQMRAQPADLVLTDLSMPDMNGLALSTALREEWPSARIVLMTGTDIESVGSMPTVRSVDTALSKPFELERLFSVVESALSADEEREGRG